MKIAIISSSVRIGRQSHKVAVELQRKLMQKEDIDIHANLIDLADYQIPHMESVLAKHPDPPQDLVKIGEQLQEADAIIFVSPEYNGGYSSALNNLVLGSHRGEEAGHIGRYRLISGFQKNRLL